MADSRIYSSSQAEHEQRRRHASVVTVQRKPRVPTRESAGRHSVRVTYTWWPQEWQH